MDIHSLLFYTQYIKCRAYILLSNINRIQADLSTPKQFNFDFKDVGDKTSAQALTGHIVNSVDSRQAFSIDLKIFNLWTFCDIELHGAPDGLFPASPQLSDLSFKELIDLLIIIRTYIIVIHQIYVLCRQSKYSPILSHPLKVPMIPMILLNLCLRKDLERGSLVFSVIILHRFFEKFSGFRGPRTHRLRGCQFTVFPQFSSWSVFCY